MSITRLRTAFGQLPDIVFPAIPHRAGRSAATVVAAAVIVTVWAPAAITTWPLASVPGATVSSALGMALLGGIRALLLRGWRAAATTPTTEDGAFYGTAAAVLLGGPAAYALLTGEVLAPASRISPLAGIAVVLWGLHELVLVRHEYLQARTGQEFSGPEA